MGYFIVMKSSVTCQRAFESAVMVTAALERALFADAGAVTLQIG
jgi:hypothetical protein